MNEITVELEDGSVVYKKTTNVIYHDNDFIKLEDIIKINEIVKSRKANGIWTRLKPYKREVLDVIRLKQGKSVLTMQDIHLFLENHLLIQKGDFNTK